MTTDLEDGYPEEEYEQSHLWKKVPFLVALARPFELILAFIILCLAGFVVNTFGGDFAHTFAASIISFAWLIMLFLYIFITPIRQPKLYNRWIHHGLETLTIILWIVTFSLFVVECQNWDDAEDAVAAALTPEQAAAVNSVPMQYPAITAMRAATWLSGAESVLLFVTGVACILGNVRT